MTLSVWRYAHLALALLASLFLVLASVTGIILAVDAIGEKSYLKSIDGYESIPLKTWLPKLKEKYNEVSELAVNYNGHILLKGVDENGESIEGYIHPITLEVVGKPREQSQFIKDVTALHRSLFLKETGRIIMGIVSFILCLIAVSGIGLVLQRQQNWRRFFGKVVKDNFAQFYHVVTGRLALIPILIIALTGAYLTVINFGWFNNNIIDKQPNHFNTENLPEEPLPWQDLKGFDGIILGDVRKIEFPFFSDDPEEFFTLKLKNKDLVIEQFTGTIINEQTIGKVNWLSEISLNLHTGRTNMIWAIILGLACINILFFIYSGFAITLKRKSVAIKNKFKASEAEYVVLFGSENGSTSIFAHLFFKQLLAHQKKAFIAEMNAYKEFPLAQEIVIFTCTYGDGDAPTNAKQFIKKIHSKPLPPSSNVSIVGFGSYAYANFCGYAFKVENALRDWVNMPMPVATINDKSLESLTVWLNNWAKSTNIPIVASQAIFETSPKVLSQFKVVEKSLATATSDDVFKVVLQPKRSLKIKSGDLLAIYPLNDLRERFYSIGVVDGKIQLIVRLHPNGLGSSYLNALRVGETIKGKIISNQHFHFSHKIKKIAFIGNGTGIAPFLGMIDENVKKSLIRLYCGFRKNTEMTAYYNQYLSQKVQAQFLQNYHFAFSREIDKQYVMDLIKQDSSFIIDVLVDGGVIMICGSLAMQKDVEMVIDQLCKEQDMRSIDFYKLNGQIKTDCY